MGAPEDGHVVKALETSLDAAHLASPGDLPEAATKAASALGWTAQLYVVDYEQRLLVLLPGPHAHPAEPLQIDGTLAGRAFQHVEPVPAGGPPGGPVGLWVPLLDGVHRFGVIRFEMQPGTDVRDDRVRSAYALLAHVFGHMLAAKRPYGDALDRHARRRRRTVASELLADLLPPLTFGSEDLLISGILEPCYGVAADAFDYSVIDDVAHLAIIDATGHSLSGTLVAAVALAVCRNSRRDGRSLYDAAYAIDETLREQWNSELFATGVLAQLDVRRGRLRYINAGHPAPLLFRGGRVVKQLEAGRRILFGLGTGEVEVAEEWLERGDWIVFYTDGIIEARDPQGNQYGLARFTDQLERSAAAGYAAPETLRRLVHALLDYQEGVLQDDATVLIAQWPTVDRQMLSAAET